MAEYKKTRVEKFCRTQNSTLNDSLEEQRVGQRDFSHLAAKGNLRKRWTRTVVLCKYICRDSSLDICNLQAISSNSYDLV